MASEKTRTKFTVDFEPVGRKLKAATGSSLLETALQSGISLLGVCGGNGTCGTCKVKLIKGVLNEISPDERARFTKNELIEGFRLACKAIPRSNVIIDIPPESMSSLQRMQVEGEEIEIAIVPPVTGINVNINPPSLGDLRSDDERIIQAMEKKVSRKVSISASFLKILGTRVRDTKWHCKAVLNEEGRQSELVELLPLNSRLIGFAADIGTTKLAMYLVDLESGKTIDKCGAMNPQIAYGEDVVSRIAYCNREKHGREILQQKLVHTLNQNILNMCKQNKIALGQIVSSVLVGNTAMHHLICGFPVQSLGEAPYVPAVARAVSFPVSEIGLNVASSSQVYLPPNVAGFVGADHLAMLLAANVANSKRNIIAMDIGTNTEISLISKGKIYSCSCASGPAFEGAHIQFGMRAARGAIERVKYDGEIEFSTIENVPPVGICGSGIVDLVAELRKNDIIDKRGAFKNNNQNVRKGEKGLEFVVVKGNQGTGGIDITLSRNDIHEIQLAKAAIQAGWMVLLEKANLTIESIDEFIFAGAFGSYIDIDSAKAIGLIPWIDSHKFKQIGNAAGLGARQLLVSINKRKEVEKIKSSIEYVELTTYPGFLDLYLQGMYL